MDARLQPDVQRDQLHQPARVHQRADPQRDAVRLAAQARGRPAGTELAGYRDRHAGDLLGKLVAERLGEAAVPRSVTVIERVPLAPSGKPDKRALAAGSIRAD
jgi:acyl-CoA synthetase (AMP-forming)/AMP-acid ligase II